MTVDLPSDDPLIECSPRASEGFLVPHQLEVVVIDGLPETTEVLRAVLQPQGIHVSRRNKLAESTNEASDNVFILHKVSTHSSSQQVVVGRMASVSRQNDPDCRHLEHPFHYADLIAAIEDLVQRPAA